MARLRKQIKAALQFAGRQVISQVPGVETKVLTTHPVSKAKYGTNAGRDVRISALAILIPIAIDLIAVLVGPQPAVLAQYAAVAVLLIGADRRYWLPLSVGFLVLTPFTYLETSNYLQYFSPHFLLLVAWAAASQKRKITTTELLLWLCIIAYMVFLLFFGTSLNFNRKLIWILLFLAILLVATTKPAKAEVNNLLRVLITVVAVAAVISLIEYTTKSNPLGNIYSDGAQPLFQKWGGYRVFSTLGHPLVNGSFYSIAFGISLAKYLQQREPCYLPLLPIFLTACALTASRTSIAAVVVAVGVCAVISVARGKYSDSITILLGALIAISAYLSVDNPLRSRDGTVEGQGSSNLRDQYLRSLGSLLNSSDYLGTGIGGSSKAVSQLGGPLGKYPIESSAIQILVGAGVIGATVIVALIAFYWLRWFKARSFVGVVGLTTYLVAASGFNLFEAYPALFPLLLIMLILGNGDPTDVGHGIGPQPRRTRLRSAWF